VPLSRFHVPDIAADVVSRGIVAEISGTTIWRWLYEDAIKPWRSRSWIFPRDPYFEEKAARALDLYARRFEDRPLGRRDFVISADEKTSIQARVRRHPSLAPAPGRIERVEHEYDRGGALAYLAAWNVHRAKIFGRCEATTGIEPFGRLVEQVMSTEPYASARKVSWIVDNGSSHRGEASAKRLSARWPNLILVHLPIHASWLNLVLVQRLTDRRLRRGAFSSVKALTAAIELWADRWNDDPKPFIWHKAADEIIEKVRRGRLKLHQIKIATDH
jgi:hypothetical protein